MMPALSEQLPHLLHLMDDPSPVVRAEVREALSKYGLFLRSASRDWVKDCSEEVKQEWEFICMKAESLALEETWLAWMLLENPAEQLEAGMLSLELGGNYSASYIEDSIEDLMTDFQAQFMNQTVENLLEFIFKRQGFDRTLREQTYLQHRLGYVLRYRRGSQLGLGILILILADRLGLDLSLVRIQGNWLLMDQSSGKNILYNPEHQGAMLIRSEEMCLEEAYRRDLLMADSLSASTEEIMKEVIESHIDGYKRSGLQHRETEMAEKLEVLRHEMKRRELAHFLTK